MGSRHDVLTIITSFLVTLILALVYAGLSVVLAVGLVVYLQEGSLDPISLAVESQTQSALEILLSDYGATAQLQLVAFSVVIFLPLLYLAFHFMADLIRMFFPDAAGNENDRGAWGVALTRLLRPAAA